MRHRSKKVTLDRSSAPRKALLKNLVASVILYENVETTLAKAKAVQPMVERLISAGKGSDLIARRKLASALPDERAVRKVLDVLAPRYQARAGGYTRIVRGTHRQGDGAQTVRLMFV